jgi:hypothetical protein
MLALAVQPFVAALLGFIIFPVVDYTGRALYGGRPFDPLDAAISFAAGAGLAGLLVTALGAVPTLAWLLKRGPVTRRQALISGAVLGNVPGLLIVGGLAASRLSQGAMPDLQLTYGPAGAVRAIAIGSFIGAASAAVFWRLAGRYIGGESPTSAG